jgi:hypothetical protein
MKPGFRPPPRRAVRPTGGPPSSASSRAIPPWRRAALRGHRRGAPAALRTAGRSGADVRPDLRPAPGPRPRATWRGSRRRGAAARPRPRGPPRPGASGGAARARAQTAAQPRAGAPDPAAAAEGSFRRRPCPGVEGSTRAWPGPAARSPRAGLPGRARLSSELRGSDACRPRRAGVRASGPYAAPGPSATVLVGYCGGAGRTFALVLTTRPCAAAPAPDTGGSCPFYKEVSLGSRCGRSRRARGPAARRRALVPRMSAPRLRARGALPPAAAPRRAALGRRREQERRATGGRRCRAPGPPGPRARARRGAPSWGQGLPHPPLVGARGRDRWGSSAAAGPGEDRPSGREQASTRLGPTLPDSTVRATEKRSASCVKRRSQFSGRLGRRRLQARWSRAGKRPRAAARTGEDRGRAPTSSPAPRAARLRPAGARAAGRRPGAPGPPLRRSRRAICRGQCSSAGWGGRTPATVASGPHAHRRLAARAVRALPRGRAAPFRALLAMVARRPGMRVLDLGCGTGGLTRPRCTPSSARGPRWASTSRPPCWRGAPAGAPASGSPAPTRRPSPALPVDLVFSNAALHWLPDHGAGDPALAGFPRAPGELADARCQQPPPRLAHGGGRGGGREAVPLGPDGLRAQARCSRPRSTSALADADLSEGCAGARLRAPARLARRRHRVDQRRDADRLRDAARRPSSALPRALPRAALRRAARRRVRFPFTASSSPRRAWACPPRRASVYGGSRARPTTVSCAGRAGAGSAHAQTFAMFVRGFPCIARRGQSRARRGVRVDAAARAPRRPGGRPALVPARDRAPGRRQQRRAYRAGRRRGARVAGQAIGGAGGRSGPRRYCRCARRRSAVREVG